MVRHLFGKEVPPVYGTVEVARAPKQSAHVPALIEPLHASALKVWQFLDQHIAEHGMPPLTREICAGVNLSVATVHYHLDELVKLGLIERVPNSSRAIRLSVHPGTWHVLLRKDAGLMKVNADGYAFADARRLWNQRIHFYQANCDRCVLHYTEGTYTVAVRSHQDAALIAELTLAEGWDD